MNCVTMTQRHRRVNTLTVLFSTVFDVICLSACFVSFVSGYLLVFMHLMQSSILKLQSFFLQTDICVTVTVWLQWTFLIITWWSHTTSQISTTWSEALDFDTKLGDKMVQKAHEIAHFINIWLDLPMWQQGWQSLTGLLKGWGVQNILRLRTCKEPREWEASFPSWSS